MKGNTPLKIEEPSNIFLKGVPGWPSKAYVRSAHLQRLKRVVSDHRRLNGLDRGREWVICDHKRRND